MGGDYLFVLYFHPKPILSDVNTSLWQGNQKITYRKSISSNDSFDVAIIGAGFSGLWSAYHLKQLQPELKIAIFEAEYVGFGASGRNGGWASAEYPTSGERVIKENGIESYRNLRAELISSIDEIGQIAKNHNWQIDYAKGGAIVFAKNSAQLARISSDIDEEHTLLDFEQTKRIVNIPSAIGSVFTPHCAAINPFKLAKALAEHLEKHGVTIFEKSKVDEIKDKSLQVNGFKVTCQISIRATEAFTPRKWMGNKQIPIYSLMVATNQLPDTLMQELRNSQRATIQEACHLITYAQFTADNRVALGGRGVRYKLFSRLSERSEIDNRMHKALERRVKSWFPQLQGCEFEYRWGGAVALTRRWQAFLNYDQESGHAQIGGYVGDGVTLSYLVAKTLAMKISNQKIPNLPFVNQKIGNWEFEPIRYLAVNAGFKATVAADFEERVTGRPSLIAAMVDPLINR
jgi:glycine/D-amino acid oxidase-like deaminating enzyme